MTIDHDLRAALDVDPSPEFLARVRERIAQEPPPARLTMRWMLWGGAAAAFAVLVIAVMITRRAPTETRGPDVLVSRSLTEQVVVPDRTAESLRHTRSAKAVALGRHVTQPFRSADDLAEILIDAREARALRRLIERGPLHPDHTYAEPATTPIAIAPIVIEPLTSGEGVRP